jgi:hypothetical protein
MVTGRFRQRQARSAISTSGCQPARKRTSPDLAIRALNYRCFKTRSPHNSCISDSVAMKDEYRSERLVRLGQFRAQAFAILSQDLVR